MWFFAWYFPHVRTARPTPCLVGAGALHRHRRDGPQPAHGLQRPGVDRPRRVLRPRRVRDRAADGQQYTAGSSSHDVHRYVAGGRGCDFVVGVARRLPGAAGEGSVPRAGDARPRGAVPRSHEALRAAGPGGTSLVSLSTDSELAAPAWVPTSVSAIGATTSGPTTIDARRARCSACSRVWSARRAAASAGR